MANRVQHLRGSHTEHSTFTGEKGEISLVTDTSANRIPTGELRVHDGTTAGGLPVKLGTTDKPLTSNIVMGSGYGIDFASYATSGNPSSNLLDDYEEGTWEPSLRGGTNEGNFNYTYQNGWYVKVGNLVVVHLNIYATTDSNNLPTGNLEVVSLPFTSDDESIGTFQCNDMGSSYQANVGQYSSIVQNAVSHIHFRGTTTNGTAYAIMQAQSMAYLRVTISYKTV